MTMGQREEEIADHVKESIEMAEEAVMEKEKVIIREQQLIAEVEKLQTSLDSLLHEAGDRTRKQVLNLKISVSLVQLTSLFFFIS